MSRENVELIRALIPPPETDLAALLRDDALFKATVEALAPLLHPEVESVAVWQGGTAYKGVDGFRELWLDWLRPWATYKSHLDELLDAGDCVVALVRDRARRADMEAEVEIITASVWQVVDGRVAHVRFYGDRREALEAAGLAR
jgi:ketosteroid isomerase-like protein